MPLNTYITDFKNQSLDFRKLLNKKNTVKVNPKTDEVSECSDKGQALTKGTR